MSDPVSFAAVVHELAEAEPARITTVFEDGAESLERVSASDLVVHGNQIADLLRRDGVGRGDRVGLQMRNHPEFAYALVGLSQIGAITVPIDPRATPESCRFYLERVGVSALIVADDVLAQPEVEAAVRAACPRIYVVSTPEGRALGQASHGTDLSEVLAGGEAPAAGVLGLDAGDPWILQYTSGTTGKAKPIVMRYASLDHYRQVPLACGYRPDDVPYTGLPLVHGNARGLALFPPLLGLADHAVISRWFTASRLWDVCIEQGATVWSNLGGIATAIYSQPPSDRDRAHSVRMVVSAGMPPALRAPFQERFGVAVQENYGTSEGGVLAVKRSGEGPSDSIGRPMAGSVVAILSPEGIELPDGETGEIAAKVQDDRTRLEYWGDPETTATKMINGWLRTGDFGWRDPEGWLYFSHRGEEGGIRKLGDFVPIETITRLIAELPEVQDVHVYGVASATAAPGEKQVVAAVVPYHPGSFDPTVVLRTCEERLKRSARPDILQIVDELPKTPTQKVRATDLEEMLDRDGAWVVRRVTAR